MHVFPMRISPSYLALLCLGASLRADVVPAALFSDNAVLQRDKPIPVWGTADAGEQVSVAFSGRTASTTTDGSGKWRIDLPSLPASATPSDLVIKGNNTITVSNVLVGEVWLASGQSNMEWVVNGTYDAAIDVPASANFPLIRHIKIKPTIAESPASTVITQGTWQVAGPETTGRFSGVGYYFARDLYQLLNVPVGIIHSSLGGTRVEAWMDPATLQSNPAFASVGETWAKILADYPTTKARHDIDMAAWKNEQAAAKAANLPFNKPRPGGWDGPWGPGHAATPSGLYNGMINPLVPYALRGAIWYQGEGNAGKASEYHALFSSMITGWRARFGQGDFPFYWVQLANFGSSTATNWAFLREAQTQTLALPATGQALAVDLGDVRDIHPRNKKDVGRRLARVALARTYNRNIVDSGPVFAKAEREGTGFRVSFTEIHGGLRAPLNSLGGFELAGEDKVFKPADAEIEKDTVIVTSAEVPEPVAVRYAWRDAPAAGLFNKEGLPAVPFRTDTW
jgi:sialate O-acetylesterase